MNDEPPSHAEEPAERSPEADADAREARMKGELSRQAGLIERLRREAEVREEDLAALQLRLESAEHELGDLRAIRDALTPPELPQRPGMDLAAAFLPASAERVSGDFYLVAEGPRDSTVLAVGDVVGHGVQAARRAAFVRTTFAAIAPFSDDPARLLAWVNTALVERAGPTPDFVTAACITYLPGKQSLRWAYAGHPPALWLDGDGELGAPEHGVPLGVQVDFESVGGAHESDTGEGVLLYTDGLIEARRDGDLFGLDAVRSALGGLDSPSAAEAVAFLRARVADFAYGNLTDDLCLLAARMS